MALLSPPARRVALAATLVLSTLTSPRLADASDGQPAAAAPLRVSATASQVVLYIDDDRPGRLEAQRVDQLGADQWSTVFEGSATDGRVTLPRGGASDPLLHRFRWNSEGTTRLGWVTEVSALPRMSHPMPWPTQVKGVSVPVMLDDLAELGAAHTHINIIIGNLLLPPDAADPPAGFIRQVDGVTLRFDPADVRALDQKVRRLTELGINVVAVVLNRLTDNTPLGHPLRHPLSDIDGAPFNLCAFNTTTPEGIAHFTGIMTFLADRYSQPDKAHGWIGGYIIGNEVDSHWTWHNLGLANLEQIARQYVDEMRLAWLAVRQAHAELPVFISLTHSWTKPNSLDGSRNVASRALLDRMVEIATQEGNFDFNIAYHPYPQDLRNPRFWNDRTAWLAYDTAQVTYKNFEVLSSYLHKPAMLVNGKPRRLIFSEQGLDTPDGPDGEAIQAAAYALSYERIRRVPHVEAYILHRHVDTREEFGLRLGLWFEKPEPAPAETPDRKKASWHVFRAAGTDQWDSATRFAMPILGIKRWDDVVVEAGPFPEQSREAPKALGDKDILFNLISLATDAKLEHVMNISERIIPLADGGIATGLFLHPPQPKKGENEGVASATFTLDLPDRKGLAFVFQTHIDRKTRDGVIFSVEVNGRVAMRRDATDDRLTDHRISLSRFAGKTIELTLKTDAKKNNNHDWATFVSPLIVATAKPEADVEAEASADAAGVSR